MTDGILLVPLSSSISRPPPVLPIHSARTRFTAAPCSNARTTNGSSSRGSTGEGEAPAVSSAMAVARPLPTLLRRLLLVGALAAFCSYYLLVIQAQAAVPPRYDGFAYGTGAAAAWKDAVLVEAFLDPLCPDSRDAWNPLKLALKRYSPRVSLIVHPFPLPYHTNAFHACRALYIANKLNSSSIYPLLELFFENQEKFSNSATSSLSSTAITGRISKMAAQAVGKSVSEFQSGFNDASTDLAARVSFKYGCTRGVAGAPFFFVNGFLQPGGGSAIDYNTWINILEPLVAQRVGMVDMLTSM